ncbi:oxoacyl-ACP reductase, putative [Eimeria necatrix]|uniref:3-oxoacyl-[acyl-carrier-protein] reductase n=1 Tax=Eimeria necatrix TaxID=51315 RepID=U6MKF6_9EIME|nr:oxoacyl-ACP reductase, putative [Eimeria necatrix]CDJ64722.1 oxoacyl-ACP reductase, putative [Eimeria necatrix]
MRMLSLALGGLCLTLFSGDRAEGSRHLPRQTLGFLSRPLPSSSPEVTLPPSLRTTPQLTPATPSAAAAADAASAAARSEGTRCFAYPLTYGGGPNGGGEGEGRVALITGASRGIGLAIAKTFAKGGVETIICVARDQAACDAAAAEVRALGAASEGYGVDVADSRSVSDLCASLLEKHKKIDILVNNAGITRDNLFIRMKDNEWTDVINTNLNSAFYFSLPLIKQMTKNRFGRIINMSSVVGVGGNPGQANYAASKAGLIGLTKSLAKEYANRNVTVNAIAPGFIKSLMTDKMTEAAKAGALASIPAGRFGTQQEVADLAAFLASDQAGYITGKVIPIDGGMLFGSN